MKRIIALVLTFTLLLALAAPAFADQRIVATGNYEIELSLDVPEEPSEIGGFTVWIPDSMNIRYGVADAHLDYNIEVYHERFPFGKSVNIDVTTESFHDWPEEDEEGNPGVNFACRLENRDARDGFDYRLYREDGSEISPAPFGYEDREEHMMDGYGRDVGYVANFDDEPDCRYSHIRLELFYPDDRQLTPGRYSDTLTFHVSTGWWLDKFSLAERGYEYIIAEGYTDELASGEDYWNGTAAFNENGHPDDANRVTGIRPIEDNSETE